MIDTIKLFATTRVKADGPESLVGIQVIDGVVKLIAGNDEAGAIITLDDVTTEAGRYSFTVNARTIIESASVLPTKDTISIDVSKGVFSIKASGGGRLDLKAVGTLSGAGFPKKPKQFSASASIYAEQWGQMARIFSELLEKSKYMNHVNLRFMDDGCYIVASSYTNDRYAVMKAADSTGDMPMTHFPVNAFWKGLKALVRDGTISAGSDGFLATDGDIEVFSLVVEYDDEWKIPVLQPMGSGVSFTMKRTDLLSAVRAQAPNDEFSRVTFEVDDRLKVTAFGYEEGLTIPVKTSGKGVRSLSADNLKGILSAMTDTKEVTLMWGNPSPGITISAREYTPWTILIAPVALR